jgi:NADPH:quinone reductase-like Zn-dependent oxidoreductase
MNAAVLHAINQAPRFEQFPEPTAQGNEVIVHVRAAALKPIDKQMASGTHYASSHTSIVMTAMYDSVLARCYRQAVCTGSSVIRSRLPWS